MNSVAMSDWSWTISHQGMRGLDRFAEPGVRDVLLGWRGLPADLPLPHGGSDLREVDERALA